MTLPKPSAQTPQKLVQSLGKTSWSSQEFIKLQSVLIFGLLVSFLPLVASFELDTNGDTVECVQCIQLWRNSGSRERACGPKASTCRGTACFMRQCKYCPVYQYMAGCVDLSQWQMTDLENNRNKGELRRQRVGASVLCEDSFNQTTCICNRRDKCNSIHSQVPYSTYSQGIFDGIIDFDKVIARLDPRYLDVISGYHFGFPQSSSYSMMSSCVSVVMLSLINLI